MKLALLGALLIALPLVAQTPAPPAPVGGNENAVRRLEAHIQKLEAELERAREQLRRVRAGETPTPDRPERPRGGRDGENPKPERPVRPEGRPGRRRGGEGSAPAGAPPRPVNGGSGEPTPGARPAPAPAGGGGDGAENSGGSAR